MKTVLILLLMFFVFAGSTIPNQNPCLELRLYQLMPNKTEAVLARFRDHIDPLFRKHGLVPLGYWIAKDSVNGDKFIYMLSAPSLDDNKKSMAAFAADPQFQKAYKLSEEVNGKTVQKIESWFLDPINGTDYRPLEDRGTSRTYEFRMYTTPLKSREKLVKHWKKSTVPLYKNHGLSTILGWTSNQNTGNDILLWTLVGGTVDEMLAVKSAFHVDPGWKKARGVSDKNDPLTEVSSFIVSPTDFSPAR